MSDTRYVYGANCTWHGPISDIGKRGGMPCCPSCGSMLFEFPHKDDWTRAVDRYEAAGHPGYRKMIDWSERRCFPSRKALEDAYAAAPTEGKRNANAIAAVHAAGVREEREAILKIAAAIRARETGGGE